MCAMLERLVTTKLLLLDWRGGCVFGEMGVGGEAGHSGTCLCGCGRVVRYGLSFAVPGVACCMAHSGSKRNGGALIRLLRRVQRCNVFFYGASRGEQKRSRQVYILSGLASCTLSLVCFFSGGRAVSGLGHVCDGFDGR